MRELILTAGHADSGLPTLLQPGMDDSALRYGQSRVGTQSLTGGGFDQLSLFSNGPLSFEGNIDLAMGRSLNLYAGTIAATGGGPSEVKLQAPYVRLSGIGMYGQQASGEFRPRLTYGPTATAEQVRLQVSAGRLLDIAGRLSFGSDGVINGVNAEAVRYQRPGFEKVTLRSEGDLSFAGDYPENGDPSGRLITHGDLQLTAAQLYPVTGASSTLYAGYGLDEGGRLSSMPNGIWLSNVAASPCRTLRCRYSAVWRSWHRISSRVAWCVRRWGSSSSAAIWIVPRAR